MKERLRHRCFPANFLQNASGILQISFSENIPQKNYYKTSAVEFFLGKSLLNRDSVAIFPMKFEKFFKIAFLHKDATQYTYLKSFDVAVISEALN